MREKVSASPISLILHELQLGSIKYYLQILWQIITVVRSLNQLKKWLIWDVDNNSIAKIVKIYQ